jgi:hypothetical protein
VQRGTLLSPDVENIVQVRSTTEGYITCYPFVLSLYPFPTPPLYVFPSLSYLPSFPHFIILYIYYYYITCSVQCARSWERKPGTNSNKGKNKKNPCANHQVENNRRQTPSTPVSPLVSSLSSCFPLVSSLVSLVSPLVFLCFLLFLGLHCCVVCCLVPVNPATRE